MQLHFIALYYSFCFLIRGTMSSPVMAVYSRNMWPFYISDEVAFRLRFRIILFLYM
jgi:hypothetical protein